MDFGRHPAMEAVSSPIKCQHRDNKNIVTFKIKLF
jgi:hypothetical protein